jgi:hypothetical protein
VKETVRQKGFFLERTPTINPSQHHRGLIDTLKTCASPSKSLHRLKSPSMAIVLPTYRFRVSAWCISSISYSQSSFIRDTVPSRTLGKPIQYPHWLIVGCVVCCFVCSAMDGGCCFYCCLCSLCTKSYAFFFCFFLFCFVLWLLLLLHFFNNNGLRF